MGGGGGRGYGGGVRGRLYLSLHCHRQSDFCIEVGSDESHFNVSFIVRDKFTRQCPQTTTFEEKGEPKRIRTEVLTRLTVCPEEEEEEEEDDDDDDDDDVELHVLGCRLTY